MNTQAVCKRDARRDSASDRRDDQSTFTKADHFRGRDSDLAGNTGVIAQVLPDDRTGAIGKARSIAFVQYGANVPHAIAIPVIIGIIILCVGRFVRFRSVIGKALFLTFPQHELGDGVAGEAFQDFAICTPCRWKIAGLDQLRGAPSHRAQVFLPIPDP